MTADFDALLAEALAAPTDGWDFTRFGDRLRTTHPPWNYWSMVAELSAAAAAMLDMGTGGGELLAAFTGRRPPLTVATESWPPNVGVAGRRLHPLGVAVVHAEGAPDNDGPSALDEPRGRLPFRDGVFPLVLNRHESFNPREVARVLAPGGTFLTQQVDWAYGDLHELLGVRWPGPKPVRIELLRDQVAAAGLRVEAGDEAIVVQTFADVGVLGWYLRQVPWAVEGVDVRRDVGRLLGVHERLLADGPAIVRMKQFWLRAAKR